MTKLPPLTNKGRERKTCQCIKCKTTCIDCSLGLHDYPKPLKERVAEAISWGFTLGYECKMSGKNKEYNDRLRKFIKKTLKHL